MNFKSILSITLLAIIILSCTKTTNYIIPVDFEKYNKEYVPGLTQEKSHVIQSRLMAEVSESTIGKELPPVSLADLNNNKLELKSLINEKTLLVLTGVHCGWGMEGLTNDLPNALQKLKENKIGINVICLLIKEDSDYENIDLFNSSLNELKPFYPNIYIIKDVDSKRLNVYANPTRMLIDINKVVTYIGLGVSTPERLYEELEILLSTKSKSSNFQINPKR